MSPEETLLTIAEIAIAVIGFAGIVSAVRPRGTEHVDLMHRLRLRIMIEMSAYVMVFAFLPLILTADLPPETVWQIGSVGIAVTAPFQVTSIYVRQRRLFGSTLLHETLLFDASTVSIGFLVEIALVVNALGLFAEPRFAGYLLGLLFPLGAAVAMFVRAIISSQDGSPPSAP